MAKTPVDRAPLVDAAASLEEELQKYERLVTEVGRMSIASEKTLARAARAVTEAAESQEHIFERIRALSQAMQDTRARQEAAVARMAEAARHVSDRASLFQSLLARIASLNDVARGLASQASEIGAKSAGGAEPAMILQMTSSLIEGMTDAVAVADSLMKSARDEDFVDIARDAESLKRQMAASCARLGQAQRAMAENAPS